MKQVLVVAHPRSRSFTLAMAEAYAEAARAEGAKVDLRDLYRMGFDPVLHAQELPGHDDFAPRADVVAAVAARPAAAGAVWSGGPGGTWRHPGDGEPDT